MKQTELTGIILAGGKSRRLGVNKAILELKGKKLIEYPVHLLEKFCSQILISSNQPLPLSYPIVSDVSNDQGPMVGIYSCLLQSKTPYNIVLSCDMPFLGEDLITLLIERIEKNKIIVPVHDNNLMEPLCAIYPTQSTKSLFESIRQERFAMHGFIQTHPHTLVIIK